MMRNVGKLNNELGRVTLDWEDGSDQNQPIETANNLTVDAKTDAEEQHTIAEMGEREATSEGIENKPSNDGGHEEDTKDQNDKVGWVNALLTSITVTKTD